MAFTCARCNNTGVLRITGPNEAVLCTCEHGRAKGKGEARKVGFRPELAAPYQPDTPQPADPYAYLGEKL